MLQATCCVPVLQNLYVLLYFKLILSNTAQVQRAVWSLGLVDSRKAVFKHHQEIIPNVKGTYYYSRQSYDSPRAGAYIREVPVLETIRWLFARLVHVVEY